MRVMFSGWHHSAYRKEIISLLSSVCLTTGYTDMSYAWHTKQKVRTGIFMHSWSRSIQYKMNPKIFTFSRFSKRSGTKRLAVWSCLSVPARVRSTVCMVYHDCYRKEFCGIWYRAFLFKLCQHIRLRSKSDKNIGNVAWGPKCLSYCFTVYEISTRHAAEPERPVKQLTVWA
jgi:hypothetical protein